MSFLRNSSGHPVERVMRSNPPLEFRRNSAWEWTTKGGFKELPGIPQVVNSSKGGHEEDPSPITPPFPDEQRSTPQVESRNKLFSHRTPSRTHPHELIFHGN